ncbi:hypothetical protein ADP71_17030 [Vitreoscilla sp. C1]|uniref:hypothetical protein n=1 Tax=Vitreoscilla sp. (strain C1) TaxID=96942 RepID=UPI000CDC61D0|nr:hypothetical protein [Vitreoscilla sp. C1]AUZ05230.1 hypothetical protein ADP71_17030 [Vitreoscilla sp. C1]
MSTNNTGRQDVVKEAFVRYIMAGVDEMLPITPALQKFITKPRSSRLRVCPSRMVDDVQDMLNTYRRSSDANGKAIDSPLPVMFIAFAKETSPIPTDRGRSVADVQNVNLNNTSGFYQVRMQHKSWRCQLVFVAHEHETATGMTDQMRLYMQRFKNHRWQIPWHHDGEEFETTGTFEDGFEPMESVIDVDGGRKNITIFAWDLTLNYVLPFVGDAVTAIQTGDVNIQVNP